MHNIKGVLLGLERVLYVGEKLVEGAIECVNKLKLHNLKIRYLTNTTTTPKKLIVEKLKVFKLPTDESNFIIQPDLRINSIADFLNYF